MDLPSSVRAQAERANELIAQLSTPAAPAEPADTPAETPAPESTPAEQVPPAPAPAPTADTGTSEPAPQPPAAPPADSTDWQHKYRTLQGIIDANNRNWASEKQQLLERIKHLEQAHAQAPAAAPAPAAPTQLITDKDVDTYGPELLDLISRQAQQIADQIVAKKMAELQPVLDQTRDQVGQTAAQVYQSAQDKFYGELTQAVPDWRTVDVDGQWHDWLREVDPLSGIPRQQYLNHAVQNLDHVHAARLFNAFKEASGQGKASTAAAAAPSPAAPTQSPSPRPVGTASAPMPREPHVGVKRSEIAAHYKRSSMDPTYRHTEDYRAMEQRISTATAAGQILEG